MLVLPSPKNAVFISPCEALNKFLVSCRNVHIFFLNEYAALLAAGARGVVINHCKKPMSLLRRHISASRAQGDRFRRRARRGCFGCHNTDAHLRSSIIRRSVTAVAENGALDLGDFDKIHFIDRGKTRARARTVQVMLPGE